MTKRICLYCLLVCWSLMLPRTTSAGEREGVDFFCGADLNYKDVNLLRLYDVLFYLTPGVKWHIGHEWQLAGQVGLPIVNEGYDKKYDYVSLKNLSLSKQFHFSDKQHVKASGGLFSRHRYGIDVKWLYLVNDWLAIDAQCGFIGKYAAERIWGFDDMNTLTFTVGAKAYLQQWNTEFGISGGRYIEKDFGIQGEVLRHFTHCTVSLFGQVHEKPSYVINGTRLAGGFRVVILLPDKHVGKGKVRLRPASNFRLTADMNTERTLQKMYYTDPEENEREGWFSCDEVKWGVNLMDEGRRVCHE